MYKLKDLMSMFDVSERSLRRHIRIGLLKGQKVGGSWRFTEEDIANYLDDSIVRKTSRKNFLIRMNEYMCGFTKNNDDILISLNKPLLDSDTVKKLTDLAGTFEHAFHFDISVFGNVHNISFIGNKDDGDKIIVFLGDEDE